MRFKFFKLTGVIAILWVVFYVANHTILRATEISALTSLIFIPGGYKMACAVIFQRRAILGLFLGALITSCLFLSSFSWAMIVMVSILSAVLPYVALMIANRHPPLKPDLSNLSIQHLISLSLTYALINGVTHVALYRQKFSMQEVTETLSMMLGDILGILFFILLVSFLARSKTIQNFLNRV